MCRLPSGESHMSATVPTLIACARAPCAPTRAIEPNIQLKYSSSKLKYFISFYRFISVSTIVPMRRYVKNIIDAYNACEGVQMSDAYNSSRDARVSNRSGDTFRKYYGNLDRTHCWRNVSGFH